MFVQWLAFPLALAHSWPGCFVSESPVLPCLLLPQFISEIHLSGDFNGFYMYSGLCPGLPSLQLMWLWRRCHPL